MFPFRKKHEPAPLAPKKIDPRATLDSGDVRIGVNVFQRSVADDAIRQEATALDSCDGGWDGIKPNGMTGLDLPVDQLFWYASHGFIGFQNCLLLSQHWLIDKICTMPARDAARVGYEIKGESITPELLKRIKRLDKRFAINKNLVEFERLNRVFGQRLAMFRVDSSDPDYYKNPFNLDGIKPNSYRGIVQIDPMWITPLVDNTSDPTDPDYYEPTYYVIGGKTIHRSHLVINKTCELPDYLKPTYRYGGVPMAQKLMERIYAAERTANEAPILAMTKRLDVLKMDLVSAMGNKNAFQRIMRFFTETRDNHGVKVIGTEEDMTRLDTSLTDLDAVIMTQYQLCAAIGEVPATKLLETAPKGFNATGEFEESSYHERLESIQEHSYTPLLDRHYEILDRSELGGAMGDFEIVWEALDSPTEAEWAEINLKRAQTGQTLAATGAIDGKDERDRLMNDPDSGYTLEERDDLEPLPDDEESNPFAGLMGEENPDAV